MVIVGVGVKSVPTLPQRCRAVSKPCCISRLIFFEHAKRQIGATALGQRVVYKLRAEHTARGLAVVMLHRCDQLLAQRRFVAEHTFAQAHGKSRLMCRAAHAYFIKICVQQKLDTSLANKLCALGFLLIAGQPLAQGDDAIILDDMRDTAFELPDLLKILDNNTSSSVRSRFANKVFNGSMIILTSSVPLNFWYKEYRYNAVDTLDQLYRRINIYVEVKDKEILVYDGLGSDGKPVGEPKRYYNEVYDLKKTAPPKRDISSMFDKICSPVKEVKIGSSVMQETFDFDDNDIF